MNDPRCGADVCALFKPTGVCCPHDSCDLEDGTRSEDLLTMSMTTLKHAWVTLEDAPGHFLVKCAVCGDMTNNAFLADLYPCSGRRPEPPVQPAAEPAPPAPIRGRLNAVLIMVVVLLIVAAVAYLAVRL